MAIKKIHIIGNSSDSISQESVEFLGRLMARFMYHEIDRASEMLHQLTSVDLENLEKAGYNLSVIAPIVKGD